ncbi:hypothetical protein D3C73_1465830 [compost metagenome]
MTYTTQVVTIVSSGRIRSAFHVVVEEAHFQLAIVIELQGSGREQSDGAINQAVTEFVVHRTGLVDCQTSSQSWDDENARFFQVQSEFLGQVENVDIRHCVYSRF